MSLGFVAANNRQPGAADFVLEQPTSIGGGRAVLHLAHRDYDMAEGRVMHRVILQGEVPV